MEGTDQMIKEEVQNITEMKHFLKKIMRIVFDASREQLRAVLEQQTESWQVSYFALRFLTIFDQKYSINELELLAVV